ncbi:protein indeterminate-domain 7-like [Andrographis paniculata]|uniref:protein indeterminate-domain 7-like n=1 Tax=Andrographis paniculata TaxID=175694 RepID=UPI0021E70E01|nr:protein indeterminate-domain 7-like [Andrographis paniculata]
MKTLSSVHHHHQQEEAEIMSNLTTSASPNHVNNNNNNNNALKRKRNQPGHPEPGAEVIALSPKTLVATNRFVCEICKKGFQRDQNLQLHRRGHNLPWKLKQRSNCVPTRKKVYVCPETTCVHHDPSRALGDLTGIKKHFCRKHGEKKWKCEKCSKKYAVQSDWKAHSKTCGSREYRCDCGTIFSRRDSFVTHRAFCDALAEEATITSSMADTAPIPVKKELIHSFSISPETILSRIPILPLSSSSSLSPITFPQNPNPRICPPPQISATALLQKAAEIGAKTSSVISTHVTGHVPAPPGNIETTCLNLDMSSRDGSLLQNLFDKAAISGTFTGDPNSPPPPFTTAAAAMMIGGGGPGFESPSYFGDDFLTQYSSSKKDSDSLDFDSTMTRDFLGLKNLSQTDILSITGFAINGVDGHGRDNHHHPPNPRQGN